jgi:hypothetical protein
LNDRHADAEARIKATSERLLSGQVPDGLKCDIKSLCVLAGVPRATLYRTYPHLKADFEQRLGRLRSNGEQPDSRVAKAETLKAEIVVLRDRLSTATQMIGDLEAFQATALSRLVAQHDEIIALRRELEAAKEGPLRVVPN